MLEVGTPSSGEQPAEVPAEEIAYVFEFLQARLNGTGERRIVNPLAE